MMSDMPWQHDAEPGRMAPRMCVKSARDEMDKAWQTTDAKLAIIHIRSAVDWLRRALEQMAPVDPAEPMSDRFSK